MLQDNTRSTLSLFSTAHEDAYKSETISPLKFHSDAHQEHKGALREVSTFQKPMTGLQVTKNNVVS